MAFLCPVRIRRGKKKKDEDKISTRTPSIGRITGSASIETLVRVGIEKENGLSPDSKMVVLHEFTPCVDDELDVKRGQIVNVLYQENDWVYVIAENNQEGFIPHSYCAPVGSHLADMALNVKHKKMPRTSSPELIDHMHGVGGGGASDTSQIDVDIFSSTHNIGNEIHPFFKDPSGRYVVLYTFIARDENDVSVERGEYVTVLNKDDPDWYWIVRTDAQEGFVPSAFVCPVDNLIAQGQANQQNQQAQQQHLQQQLQLQQQQQQQQTCKAFNSSNSNVQININDCSGSNELSPEELEQFQSASPESEARFHGTELVMLYDYKAQAADDLSVRRGDWVYANLTNQTVDGWLWAYAPKIRKYGFIPKAYARPPAMTSL